MAETRYDVLVIGAGPAGLSAAVAASESGVSVGILDDNSLPGGQIYRASHGTTRPEIAKRLERLKGAQIHSRRTVYDAPAPGVVAAIGPNGTETYRYGKLILAVGARELFLPFPGWTL